MERGEGARVGTPLGVGPILVVEDDEGFARLLALALRRDLGAAVEVAASAADACARLTAAPFAAAIVDRRLPDGDGVDVLRRLRAGDGSLPVIVLTADGAAETAVAAMRAGACDYLVKSRTAIADVVRAVARIAAPPAATPGPPAGAAVLVGTSEAMARLRAAIVQCARSPACVLVEGETGSGKELVARALHAGSSRASGPFVAVNCGALPEHLVESELFGHVRGAFTGAHRDHPGLVEAAARGTLFLDEVEDLPLALQGKLLRLLQESEYRPLGAVRSRAADVRVVAASNADLAGLVAARRFRSDLFYRLDVLRIAVPPLRDRASDVPALIAHLLLRVDERAASRDAAAAGAPRLPPAEDLVRLIAYAWPGNVRELANLVERAHAFSGAVGWPAAWRSAIVELVADRPGTPRAAAPPAAAAGGSTVAWAAGDASDRGGTVPGVPATASDAASALRRILDRHRWRREAAARELGISRVTLWRRMRRLGLASEIPGEP